jgi:hypothetical protein
LLERITKPGYFGVMNAQLDTLEWRDVGMVERLQREGKYGQASKINDHFVSLYSQLTPAQQRAVTQFQGVNGSLLSDNARFLKTRSGM